MEFFTLFKQISSCKDSFSFSASKRLVRWSIYLRGQWYLLWAATLLGYPVHFNVLFTFFLIHPSHELFQSTCILFSLDLLSLMYLFKIYRGFSICSSWQTFTCNIQGSPTWLESPREWYGVGLKCQVIIGIKEQSTSNNTLINNPKMMDYMLIYLGSTI